MSAEMHLERFGESNDFSKKKKTKRVFGTSNFECFEGALGNILRTSWGRPESTSQGQLLNVRLVSPWASFQDVSRTSVRYVSATSDENVPEMVKYDR